MILKGNTLLTIDGVVNLALGLQLMFAPGPTARFLGLPVPTQLFYAGLLGAVLTGIGAALFVERFRSTSPAIGLGLGGAIAINTFGALALVMWLLLGGLDIPLRGLAFLWIVAIGVLGICLVEIWDITRSKQLKS
jgi:hypothetical protein